MNPLARYELRVVLLAIAVVLAGIPFGILLHQVATDGPLTGLDDDLAADLRRSVGVGGADVVLMRAVTFLGDTPVRLVITAITALWLWRHGAVRLVGFLVVTGAGGGLVSTAVKAAVGRERPVSEILDPIGESFPSGHAMGAVVTYGALLVVLAPVLAPRWRRPALVAVVVLAVAIGVSRLVLQVHYLSDVIGGWVLGAAWLAASVAAFETWRVERGRPRTEPVDEGLEPNELGVATSE